MFHKIKLKCIVYNEILNVNLMPLNYISIQLKYSKKYYFQEKERIILKLI